MTGSRSLPLMRIFGIRVGVNYSWFLVLFVVIFVLWDSLSRTLDASDTTVYVVAVVAAASFFASIVAHELGHALAARREGIAVEGIDLFLFGGVMKMSRDTDSPGAEFRVAVGRAARDAAADGAAAVAAVLLAGGDSFWDAARLSAAADASPVEVVVSLLVSMNLLLLLFNLVPAFPLDGGRIARAAAWKLTGDRTSRDALRGPIGIGFGWLLIARRARARGLRRGRGVRRDLVRRARLAARLRRPRTLAQTRFTEQLAGHHRRRRHGRRAGHDPRRPAGPPRLRGLLPALPGLGLVRGRRGRRPLRRHRPPRGGRARGAAGGRRGAGARARRLGRGRRAGPADAPLEALLSSEPLRRLGALMAVDAEGRLRGVVTFEQVTRALRARLAPSA